ncbi:MAG: integral rane protein, partial [Polaromonas sp.]|nr:integral rane protein [Polaromonas sp.]
MPPSNPAAHDNDTLPLVPPSASGPLPGELPVMATPYVAPPPVGPQALMLPLGAGAPFGWLAAGWRDLAAHPGIGLFYGACFWLMAFTLGAVFRAKPEYTLTIASGCLLVGPFLAMGLYETSRRRERGLTPALGESLTCWDAHIRSMGMLVLVLVVLELLWGRASLVVFAVFFNTGMPSTTGVINAVFNPGNLEFIAVYLAVGGLFAALVFSTAVVSIPMILDRDTDAVTAAITSIRVVLSHPGAMLLWGLLLTALTGLGLM